MATRAINRLTSLDVRRATKRGLHPDGNGLYLQIARNGSRSWVLRYRLGRARRYLGLGALHSTSLSQARELAAAARRQLLAGEDPVAARQAKQAALRLADAKAMTFAQAAASYIEAHRPGWRNADHANQWRNSLATHAFPIIGALPVAAIDTTLVMQVLDPIWTTKTETAGRVRGRIESVLNWASARGYRTGDNPARWRGHLDHLLPDRAKVAKVEHLPALPYADLPDFLAELRQRNGIPAKALEFAILTAARPGEVLLADWSEIDFAARVWAVPGTRMKAGRDHRVPLSDAAMAVLEALPEPRSEPVFPGARPGRPIGRNALMKELRRMGRGDLTVHGFRSTFRDWAAEATEFPGEVCEAALTHAIGDKTEAAYRRGDLLERRRLLMAAWAAYGAGEQVGATITTLRRA
jgi:integrase